MCDERRSQGLQARGKAPPAAGSAIICEDAVNIKVVTADAKFSSALGHGRANSLRLGWRPGLEQTSISARNHFLPHHIYHRAHFLGRDANRTA
jgi:hypothetical protein